MKISLELTTAELKGIICTIDRILYAYYERSK